MNVEVKVFAVAREVVGSDTVTLTLSDPATVRQLRAALVERYPALASTMRHMLVAVDADYARDDAQLTERSEVALIPPVSGG